MKKIIGLLLVVAVIFGMCSCIPTISVGGNDDGGSSDGKDKYMTNPFGTEQINKETANTSVTQGTYLACDNMTGYFGVYNYYLVSLKSGGAMSITPIDGYMFALSDGFTTGTWSEECDVITLNSGFGTYIGTKEELINTKTSEVTGIAVVKSSVDYIKLRKISDSYLDETLHTTKKLNGLYAKSNDFGEVDAYRFLEDGTYYNYYYSDYDNENVTYKGTYFFSLNGTQIMIILTCCPSRIL